MTTEAEIVMADEETPSSHNNLAFRSLYNSYDLEDDLQVANSSYRSNSSTASFGYRPKLISGVKRTTSKADDLRTNEAFSIEIDQINFSTPLRREKRFSLWRALWLRQPVLVAVYHDPKSEKEDDRLTASQFVDAAGITMDDLRADIELHSTLRHPNLLLHMCSVIESDRPFCLVSEYTRKEPISTVLEKSVLNAMEILHMSVSIARGLLYLHSFNPPQLHGFLHPSNTLVDSQRSDCVLSEFRMQHQQKPSSDAVDEIGTVQYMAPELLANEAFSPETDCYAFGMLVWHLWAGEPAFQNLNMEELKERKQEPSFADLVGEDGLPPELSSLVTRCVAPNPEDRPDLNSVLETLRSDELYEAMKALNEGYSSATRQSAIRMPPRLKRSKASSLSDSSSLDAGSFHGGSSFNAGLTPSPFDREFMDAVHSGDLQKSDSLLGKGAMIESRNYDKRTALHIAACDGNSEMVKLLLSKGAMTDVRDRWGSTPLHDAQQAGHHEVILLLQIHGLRSSLGSSGGRGSRGAGNSWGSPLFP
uniref:Protein kinase domain-containing protein n=1 Tax=Rhodosorus marinus TaxID=101924 RepID=A0A7S3EJ00_9RHOD|mmetsp:Transcript_39871/g.158623  ORF Transcript_39871/g.158623 Transcript_39871/m.158623 type:complete len:533 (+) Transcript_39871:326-1924(+)